MSSWPASLRIARREARKAKGRAGLVLAMIALPVAVLSFAAVSYDMFALTPQEAAQRSVGSADALLTWMASQPVTHTSSAGGTVAGPVPQAPGGIPPVTRAQLLKVLPPGARVIAFGHDNIRVRGPSGIINVSSRVLDIGDPMARGMAEMVAGRPPSGDGEVALSMQAARELSLRPGDTLHRLAPAKELRIVGLVELPDQLTSVVAFPSDSVPEQPRPPQWLMQSPAPLSSADLEKLNAIGVTVTTRAAFAQPSQMNVTDRSAEAAAVGVLAGGLVALEVILLAGPAFAVGARRRARDLALIAAAGGEPKHLRRVVLADGVVLGFGGGLIGLVIGVCAAVASRSLVEEHLAHARAGGWRFFPAALAGIAFLAVATGLLAAAVPAFIAARQNVVQVLNGRRGVLRSRRRWIALGLAMVGIGALVGLLGASRMRESLMLLGIVLVELGLVLLTPALVGLIAKAGRWMPLAMRLALRDTARNRTAAAPAISAIMAAVAGAVVAGVILAGSSQQQRAAYVPSLPPGHFEVHAGGDPAAGSPDWAAVQTAVRTVLPSAEFATYQAPVCPEEYSKAYCEIAVLVPPRNRCPYVVNQRNVSSEAAIAVFDDDRCAWPQFGHIYGAAWLSGSIVDDGDALKLLTGATDADIAAARRVLQAGGVVVTNPQLIEDGQAAVAKMAGEDGLSDLSSAVEMPAYYLATAQVRSHTMVSTGAAARLAMPTSPRSVVGTAGFVPSKEQAAQLEGTLAALGLDVYVLVELGPGPGQDPAILLLALGAAVIALGAAGIATGLAAVDSRADLATLAAIGAAPQMRRRLAVSRAGIIAGLGALLGTVAGLGGAAVMVAALNQVYENHWPPTELIPFAVPWQGLAIIVLVPLVAMTGAALFTRAQLPIERRM